MYTVLYKGRKIDLKQHFTDINFLQTTALQIKLNRKILGQQSFHKSAVALEFPDSISFNKNDETIKIPAEI